VDIDRMALHTSAERHVYHRSPRQNQDATRRVTYHRLHKVDLHLLLVAYAYSGQYGWRRGNCISQRVNSARSSCSGKLTVDHKNTSRASSGLWYVKRKSVRGGCEVMVRKRKELQTGAGLTIMVSAYVRFCGTAECWHVWERRYNR
jgi:hypothetical protein